MTKTRLVTLATLAGLLLAGCAAPTTQSATTASTTQSATTASPSPSSSPTSATSSAPPTTTPPEEQATAKAEEVLRAYYRAQTDCLSDPMKTELTCFDNVAIGTALLNMRNALTAAKEMESRVSGEIRVLSVEATQVDLTNKVTQTPPVVPQITFNTCIDVSNYNIVDRAGKSIVPPDRRARSLVPMAVVNYQYPDPSQWRVGYRVDDKTQTC